MQPGGDRNRQSEPKAGEPATAVLQIDVAALRRLIVDTVRDAQRRKVL